MLTPPRDLSDPDNIADSVLYWRTRRAAANSSAIPAAGGATALALLAATTLPTLAGGRSDTTHSAARGAGRLGVDAKTRSHLVGRVPQRTAFRSNASTGLGAPVAAASSQTRAAVTYGTITQVQKLLGVTADGKLGAVTAAAIRDFQSKHGLTANGVVDQTTFNAMQAAYTPPAQPVAPTAAAPTVAASSGAGGDVIAHAAMASPTTVAATAPVVATAQTPASTGGTSAQSTASDTTTPIAQASTTTDGGGAPATAATTATTADVTSATPVDPTATAVGTQPAVPSGVSAVQAALHLPVDGTFGSATKAAVETFQANHGLTADGVVGPATRAALGIGDGPTLQDTQPPPPPPAPPTTATTTGASATTGDGAATSPATDAATSTSDTSTSTSSSPAATSTSTTTSTSTATSTSSDGTPSNIATGISEMIQAGNQIAKLPYIWGGGHGSWVAPGYDCSGSVSYVLHAAGLLSVPEDSGTLMSYGAPGPGKYVTIYANAGHAWMTIDGQRFDTVALSEDGSRWSSGGGEFAGFVERHPIGY